MGGAAIELTRRFPKLKVIMQDKPEVIESAKKVRTFFGMGSASKFDEDNIAVLGDQRTGLPRE